ncbi:Tim44/TimA family putative adaptor protein [uncultured Aliiroseovarius sp.]|uniref:Tim44/TimA family putative adaptor protein n=1 Tax=uncultured Aliiroseovarius sp. TaxID=1658783 RepID=UPI00261D577A|nr:Tim44/TimA family putative adaptor protein [uncultured Aliiroseovarius sp.]
MSSSLIQLLVLAGIALFLILRLRDVLGTREGFEKPVVPRQDNRRLDRSNLEVIEGGPDRDILDHADEGSASAQALAAMKTNEPGFNVGEFLGGARGAYEMILMGFEAGEMSKIQPFLSEEVYETFASVVEAREAQGLSVEANFVGVRELKLEEAAFDTATREGEITVKFVGELTSVVRDKGGDIIEGNPNEVKRQKDVWTFARIMGSDNPNWQLVATGG